MLNLQAVNHFYGNQHSLWNVEIFDLRRKRTRFNNTKTEQYARLFRRKGHLMLMKRFQCKLML